MVLMKFLTCACPQRELKSQDSPGSDGRMRVVKYGGILYPLPQKLHEFFRWRTMKKLVGGIPFTPVWVVLIITRSKELNESANRCIRRHHYEYHKRFMRAIAFYWGPDVFGSGQCNVLKQM